MDLIGDASKARIIAFIIDNLIRTLARLLEANPILLGGIPAGIAIFSSPRKQRIGDSLAGTVVVSRQDITR